MATAVFSTAMFGKNVEGAPDKETKTAIVGKNVDGAPDKETKTRRSRLSVGVLAATVALPTAMVSEAVDEAPDKETKTSKNFCQCG